MIGAFVNHPAKKPANIAYFFNLEHYGCSNMARHAIINHDRGANQSDLVYPVVSRRSGGLSVGINLFPDAKRCSFDCPYCEVRPFEGKELFSPKKLEAALERFFTIDYRSGWASVPVRDICISGNGEPTLSPRLEDALGICASARRNFAAVAGRADIVLITNSTGFLHAEVANMLRRFGEKESLKIWAKLDAGTQDRFALMSRSPFLLADIVSAIGAFARTTPVVIQTMLCAIDGVPPDSAEADAYASCLNTMLDDGAFIDAVHFYTIARPPLETWASPISDEAIGAFMGRVARSLSVAVPLSGYGASGMEPVLLR